LTGGYLPLAATLASERIYEGFLGSYEDFRHVLVHELVHAFQFDILYNGSGISLLSGQGFFSMPLWFAEGMAEYFSLGGMEPNADMFLRDGSLTGYLPPLEVASGYLVYKMGQSAIADLIEQHGEERFRELLRRARQMHNFDRAFEKTYDLPVRKFDEQWRERLRKRYWPTVAARNWRSWQRARGSIGSTSWTPPAAGSCGVSACRASHSPSRHGRRCRTRSSSRASRTGAPTCGWSTRAPASRPG